MEKRFFFFLHFKILVLYDTGEKIEIPREKRKEPRQRGKGGTCKKDRAEG